MKLKYGYSYYPEHCKNKDEIDHDIELISASGANVVRMGEFCWDQIEKSEGEYDFDTFIYTVDELGKRGIYTVLCTPTACPPSWLMRKHPEISFVDYRGVKRPFGARHHYCYNSPIYREYSVKIAKELADVFGKSPYVLGFQVGNEFAQESSGRCHCEICQEKFRKYLKEKYKTIDNLNYALGTYFWGESFSDFSDIRIPIANYVKTEPDLIHDFYDNPGLRLNYENFASNCICEYMQQQSNVLYKTGKIITTNATGFGKNQVNYYDFFKELDVFGFDIYPTLYKPDNTESEFTYAFSRAMKHRPFWALEFAIGGGHGLWAKEGRPQPIPGAIEISVMHAFSHGVELMTHFQYKTFRSGAEQLNYALLDQDRVPRRRYKEFQKTAAALEKHSYVLENSFVKKPSVAIVFDYNALWALEIKPVNHDFNYIEFCANFYNTLRTLGIEADVVSPKADFDNYALVIAPTPIITDEEYIKSLKNYVLGGGCLVGTFLTSVKDCDNVAYDVPLPGHLNDVFGIEVSEVEPVFDDTRANIEICVGEKIIKAQNYHWLDELDTKAAETIGVITNTYRKDKTAVSKNHYGDGSAYYIGTMIDNNALKKLLGSITSSLNISRIPFEIPKGCSVTARTDGKKDYYFIFNFNTCKTEIILDKEYTDVDKNTLSKITLDSLNYICITR